MECSGCVGLMAVLAISSSVALVALQFNRRLLSDFLKRAELELGPPKKSRKKRVSFAADVIDPSTDNKEYRRRKKRL